MNSKQQKTLKYNLTEKLNRVFSWDRRCRDCRDLRPARGCIWVFLSALSGILAASKLYVLLLRLICNSRKGLSVISFLVHRIYTGRPLEFDRTHR